ncbi:G5 domain-containing protein [Streptococcus sp. GP0011]|uniref:G5 domain-containing protein n=1 Tax=Streptococcus sp. GP0011 TaxID=3063751 RepID=UPI0026E24724|nr:G5 domain-containing protein [Streptococcus sp. GP0011]MDO6346832.1 G5 domain-containing protein [Streptococcus sp. GP0011]
MSRKKLLKLGISILALNALGVATYHVAPDLYQIPTVHAEETPAEDEEIPDGQERSIANTFKRMLDSIESSIKDFTNSPDEDNKELLEGDVEEAKNFFETAKKAMKSPEGQKSFAALEARYNSLKAKAEALLTGGDLKEEHQEVTTTEEIPYPSRTENNADLAEGTRKVKQAGEKGQKKVVWDVTLVNDVEKKRDRKSQTVIKEPVEEIIEVGTKKTGVETKETVTVEEKVAFKEETKVDPALDKGQTRVEEGEEGVDEVTYEVTKVDGVEKSRKEVSRKTKKAAKNKITYTGGKAVVTTKEVTKTEEVAFQTREVENALLAEGVRRVKTAGQKGVRTIVETVTYTDGVETGRVEKSNTITTPAVDEVVEVGTKKVVAPVVTTKEETKTEEVAFQTKEVTNPDLPEGTRQVKTAGKKGVRTIVYTVTYTDGVETGRVEKSNTITTPAVDEVVEVGTKKVVAPVVTTKEETKTEDVAFQTKEVTNPDLPEGSRQVKTAGKKGVRTIVYTVTYTDGVETGRVEKSSTITTPAVDEIVEVGTKKVTPTTTNGDKNDTAITGNQAESTKKEETASQDKKVLPSTGTASTSLLSMIGLFIAGLVGFVARKKD